MDFERIEKYFNVHIRIEKSSYVTLYKNHVATYRYRNIRITIKLVHLMFNFYKFK